MNCTDGLIVTAISALAAWIGKVWALRIAREEDKDISREIEALRGFTEAGLQAQNARLEKEVHVHKVQYEKEFAIYLELSKAVCDLRKTLISLHSDLKTVPIDPDLANQQAVALKNDFISSFAKFRDVVVECKPFYAKEVHDHAVALIDLSSDEIRRLHLNINRPYETDRINALKKSMIECTDAVLDAIHQRINSVKVIN